MLFQYMILGYPRPSDYESPPITTRPRLPPCIKQYLPVDNLIKHSTIIIYDSKVELIRNLLI